MKLAAVLQLGALLGASTAVADEAAPPWLRVGLSVAAVGRGLSYTDPITPNIRPYEALALVAPGLRLTVSPFRLLDVGALAPLAFSASYRRTLLAKSGEDGEFGTEHDVLQAGLSYEVGVGPLAIGPSVGWSLVRFSLADADSGADPGVPDVLYSGPRFGGELSLRAGDDLTLFVAGAFVLVLEAGEIISADWFYTGKVNGLTASFGGRYRVAGLIAIGIEAEYQHYFYDFDPEPSDRFIAGGALDQMVTISLAVDLVL